MTTAEFEARWSSQDGKCAICRNALTDDERTHVDHCHSTGRVRGLLCHWCNVGIGALRENPKILTAAIGYLMQTEDIVNRFDYHPALTQERRKEHEDVRNLLKMVALTLNVSLPTGREKSIAITKLEEAMYWSNAALARQPQ